MVSGRVQTRPKVSQFAKGIWVVPLPIVSYQSRTFTNRRINSGLQSSLYNLVEFLQLSWYQIISLILLQKIQRLRNIQDFMIAPTQELFLNNDGIAMFTSTLNRCLSGTFFVRVFVQKFSNKTGMFLGFCYSRSKRFQSKRPKIKPIYPVCIMGELFLFSGTDSWSRC